MICYRTKCLKKCILAANKVPEIIKKFFTKMYFLPLALNLCRYIGAIPLHRQKKYTVAVTVSLPSPYSCHFPISRLFFPAMLHIPARAQFPACKWYKKFPAKLKKTSKQGNQARRPICLVASVHMEAHRGEGHASCWWSLPHCTLCTLSGWREIKFTWQEIFGKKAVCFPGGMFARRYIFLAVKWNLPDIYLKFWIYKLV